MYCVVVTTTLHIQVRLDNLVPLVNLLMVAKHYCVYDDGVYAFSCSYRRFERFYGCTPN